MDSGVPSWLLPVYYDQRFLCVTLSVPSRFRRREPAITRALVAGRFAIGTRFQTAPELGGFLIRMASRHAALVR